MSEDLLTYYNRELSWFKKALASFSEAHPKAAANLRISEETVEDPHVSRLIESVAFLNARIQSRLDDDFPRVVASLLEHLYPFYLAPKPSMILAKLNTTAGLDSVVHIDRGSYFETEAVDGVACKLQSTYPVSLTPLSIAKAQLLPKPFNTPGSEGARGATSVLELRLDSAVDDFSLAEQDQDSLVVHIKPDQLSWNLYDLLYKSCVNIIVASSDLDPTPIQLPPDKLKPWGLGTDQRILPDIGDTESYYQLLAEYFYYNEKFLFFEISGLKKALEGRQGSFQIYIYLSDNSRELEHALSADSLSLHCTPVINIFSIAAEPSKIKREVAEYQVIPDSNAIGDMEVYGITNVSLLEDGSGDELHVAPYYGYSHDSVKNPVFWHSSRRPALTEVGRKDATTDFFLSLTTLEGKPAEERRQTMQIECLCSNGNLPAKLPYGGGQPHFFASEPIKGLKNATSLSPPSVVRRLDLGHGLLWRLLSHLNLNYLSLVGSKNPAEQLREMLRLYDHGDAPTIRAQIDSIDSLHAKIVSLPMSVDGRPVICRGIDIEIMFDPSLLNTGSALLFGDVLMQFLSMYANLNSFVRLTIRIKGRDGIYHRWEPRVGSRPII